MNEKKIELIKKQYEQGKRIKLLQMDDMQAPPYGTIGTVTGIDDIGQVHVNWDNGQTLALIFGEDDFTLIN